MFYGMLLLLGLMMLCNCSSINSGAQFALSFTDNEKETTNKDTTESASTATGSSTYISTPAIHSLTSESTKSADSTTLTTTTPSPNPSPYPEPSVGQWNSSCIMIKMAAQLNIAYATKDKNISRAVYNIPTNATYYDGQCKPVTQTIQVNWGNPDAQGLMLLEFDLKNSTVQLTMMHFVIPIVGDQFPNALEKQTIFLLHMGKNFATPVKYSYHCTRSQIFNLTETLIDPNVAGTVTIHDVQIEAFRSSNNSNIFSPARNCEGTAYPDIIPIAVGVALISMIFIILVAYFCARRSSTPRGYMSF